MYRRNLLISSRTGISAGTFSRSPRDRVQQLMGQASLPSCRACCFARQKICRTYGKLDTEASRIIWLYEDRYGAHSKGIAWHFLSTGRDMGGAPVHGWDERQKAGLLWRSYPLSFSSPKALLQQRTIPKKNARFSIRAWVLPVEEH